jgi:PAS domain S-box-containing protein
MQPHLPPDGDDRAGNRRRVLARLLEWVTGPQRAAAPDATRRVLPSSTPETAEQVQVLRRRLQLAAATMFLASLAFTVSELFRVRPDPGPFYALDFLRMLAGLLVWRGAARQTRLESLVRDALVLSVAGVSTFALEVMLHGDASAFLLHTSIVAMGTAGLLPWGARAQAVAAGMWAACVLAVLAASRSGVTFETTAITFLAIAVSVPFAHLIERDRDEAAGARQRFRENLERLRQIAEHLNGVLWLSETSGRLLYLSPRYDELWGRDRAELWMEPEAWLRAVHPEERAEVETRFREDGWRGTYDCTYRLQGTGGEPRWIHDCTFPITDAEGVVVRIARLSQDVSAEQKAYSTRRMRELAWEAHATREEERRRIAREIHDELGQALIGIKLRLASCARAAELGTMVEDIRAAMSEIDGALGSIRSVIHALRPPSLDELGLGAALRQHAREFERQTGITCELELPDENPALSDEQATAVFRVVQESLTNVARHAGATRALVRLLVDRTRLRLWVEDDGAGIAETKRSFGLSGMRERAALFNGSVWVVPRSGGGTVVRMDLPRPAVRRSA